MKKFVLRMEDGVYQRLQIKANHMKTSINSLINDIITKSLVAPKVQKQAPLKVISSSDIMISSVISPQLTQVMNEFKAMRKSIKAPLTDGGERLILKRLDKLSNGDEQIKIKILEQSIERSWRGVFELSDSNGTRSYQENRTDELKRQLREA